jgi:histidyl-tRNA synthetase
MASSLIQPRTLKGFRDFLPEAMIPREELIATAKRVYRSYGFCPIDTPALEYLEILDGKGGDESNKQLYRFEDHGGRAVALRFDLTVPLARFVAQHANELGMPFKRYHIATVWRGENTQLGRYREFMQCDFDTIGTQSIAADIETALVIHDLMQAIGFRGFKIHINNRMVLNGVLEKLNLTERATTILRSLDKLSKIGRGKVQAEMIAAAGTTSEEADAVLRLAELKGDSDSILSALRPLVAGSELGESGVERLSGVLNGIRAAGVSSQYIELDVSIARGLDYYTGLIYETILDDLPTIGSVCSGGRYDNLTSLFTKQELPGVGASLGLDRLLAAMEKLGIVEQVRTTAEVMIPFFDRERLGDYLAMAAALRRCGLRVEFYPDPKKLGQQLKYADNRGASVALIAGSKEFAAGICQVKDLRSGESEEVLTGNEYSELVAKVQLAISN